jgi:hypothetical protein
MLTPKRRSRDFGVRAHAKLAQNRLCRFSGNPGRRNLAGFRDKLGPIVRAPLVPVGLGRAWLCWQSAANPSLPAKVGNAGRFRQKAARAATDPYRKSRHFNALDPPLPNLESRASAVHSREGTDIRSQVGDVRFRRKSRLPPPPDRCQLMTQSGHRPNRACSCRPCRPS